MAITKFPNGVSSHGMPLVGFSTGSVFFVHSGTGSNGNSGTDPSSPFATIAYALTRCTTNVGDVVFAMPGHTEVIIAADTVTTGAIAGVSVIGLGNGTNRPTITYTTAAAASFGINSANILLENLYFDITGVDAVTTAVDIDAANCTIRNCEFLMADGSGQAVVAVHADTAASNVVIEDCKFLSPDDGATAAVHFEGSGTGRSVRNCHFDGDFDAACIYATAAQVDVLIANNYFRNDNAAKSGLDLGATTVASEGIVAYNLHNTADTAGWKALLIGACQPFENYSNYSATKSGALLPAVTATA